MSTSFFKLSFAAIMIALLFSCNKNSNISDETTVLTGVQDRPITLTNRLGSSLLADYIIQGDYVIESAVVIEPGTRIMMSAGANIIVQGGGSLKAEGTGQQPITVFGQSNVKGFWGYLRINSNNANNILDHVHFRNGGGSSSWNASVYCYENSRLRMRNSRIEESGEYGFLVYSHDFRLDEFSNNTIRGAERAPVSVTVFQASNIEGNNVFEANGLNHVEVLGGQLNVNAQWAKLSVPYFLQTMEITARLTLSPGCRLNMAAGSHLAVSSTGSLNAVGSPTDRIIIQGAQPTKGFWGGIRFVESNNNDNHFQYVDLSYGGGDASWDAIIYLWLGSRLRMGNSTVTNSQRWGLIGSSGNTYEDLGNNIFNGNDAGDIQ